MNNEGVHAIIGPQCSAEAKFVIDLGRKAQVPIISFSATSPSLLSSPTQSPFFIRTCQDDCYQVKPLAAIVQAFGWRQVVLIYEDTEFGHGLIPYLTDELQQIDTRIVDRSVVPPTITGKGGLRSVISKMLDRIKGMETKVILVHVTASLGAQLFLLADEAGMMSEGYVWIITAELSTLLHPSVKKVSNSMLGVLGVRPSVSKTKRLHHLRTKWKLGNDQINLFGLWAYDTIWALAKAVELVSPVNNNSNIAWTSGGHQGLVLRASESGPRLLNKLLSIRFEGLSGQFRLNNISGQLQAAKSGFEIINVRENGEIVVGHWTREKGIIFTNSSTRDEPKESITWPGENSAKHVPPPKGWDIPVSGKKLRIGVPVNGYREFMNVKWDPKTLNVTKISGFSYDIFAAALEKLPFKVPHEFSAHNGTYDDLLYQIVLEVRNVSPVIIGHGAFLNCMQC